MELPADSMTCGTGAPGALPALGESPLAHWSQPHPQPRQTPSESDQIVAAAKPAREPARAVDRASAGISTTPIKAAATSARASVPIIETAAPSSPGVNSPAPRAEPAESPAPPHAPEAPACATPLVPPTPKTPPPLLFEVAWEVCWQLGGIYTVLRSKAAAMLARWGERYFLVGPYNPQTAAVEFEEQPTEGFIRQTLDRLREQGIPCHFGRWLIPGRPRVILLDHRARYSRLADDKYLLWADHHLATTNDDGEVNEVTAFGFTVAEFFRILCQVVGDRTILAHFHEWMAGLAVPRIAHMGLPVTTVFTTHATLLGRYLAGDNPYFYDHLPFLDPDREAAKYQIFPRYAIERAAAHAATVFTTVSEVTAVEAERLLGRRADVILPNGLNIQRFAALHEFQNLHRQYKEKIHDFVMGHFFPSYTFDLDRTIYLFTSGRYEYRNKGMDMFIEAMAQLNERLKRISDPPTVVAFIITRAPTRSINVQVLQNQSMFEDLERTCDELKEAMGLRLFQAAVRGRMPGFAELLNEDAQVRLKRAMHAWRSPRQPLIVTHDLLDDASDPVLRHLRHRGLFNSADDPVKVIFHPDFVSVTKPLISLDYENFVRGCHMGIFPSYYEPWGYTPMESVALGLPAVTTDLSGFGAYVEHHIADNQENGIVVIKRRGRSFDAATSDLVDYLTRFAQLNRRQRIELRNRVERLSEKFDWSVLIGAYHEAHELALERVGARRPGSLDIRVV